MERAFAQPLAGVHAPSLRRIGPSGRWRAARGRLWRYRGGASQKTNPSAGSRSPLTTAVQIPPFGAAAISAESRSSAALAARDRGASSASCRAPDGRRTYAGGASAHLAAEQRIEVLCPLVDDPRTAPFSRRRSRR